MFSFLFYSHGKIQSVKLTPAKDGNAAAATVAFTDIKSASKAHNSENKIEGHLVETEYNEPTATGSTVTRPHQPAEPARVETAHRGHFIQSHVRTTPQYRSREG